VPSSANFSDENYAQHTSRRKDLDVWEEEASLTLQEVGGCVRESWGASLLNRLRPVVYRPLLEFTELFPPREWIWDCTWPLHIPVDKFRVDCLSCVRSMPKSISLLAQGPVHLHMEIDHCDTYANRPPYLGTARILVQSLLSSLPAFIWLHPTLMQLA
jgi:hypothetical protein